LSSGILIFLSEFSHYLSATGKNVNNSLHLFTFFSCDGLVL